MLPAIGPLVTGARMSSWFTTNLGDAMLADESLERIRERFLTEYRKANYPKDMAVFVRHESEGRLHCDAKVFLSPALAALAKEFAATPCARPSSNDLGLLAGSEESWALLFPDA